MPAKAGIHLPKNKWIPDGVYPSEGWDWNDGSILSMGQRYFERLYRPRNAVAEKPCGRLLLTGFVT